MSAIGEPMTCDTLIRNLTDAKSIAESYGAPSDPFVYIWCETEKDYRPVTFCIMHPRTKRIELYCD